MKNILIIYNEVQHYRKPFFNKLGEKYNLTVLHSGEPSLTDGDEKYGEIVVECTKIGPFFIQPQAICEVDNPKYECIISLFDVRWLSILYYLTFKRNKKYILWGAWLTSSPLANRVRFWFLKHSFTNIFYTDSARKDFVDLGLKLKNQYVANNTFDVGMGYKSYLFEGKNRLLFVGSFDARKKIDKLVFAFSKVLHKIPENITLTLVGDGVQYEYIKEYIHTLGISSRVELVGRVNENEELVDYYKESLMSVSYGQAGLSVLQSLGYGVPFVTESNAISGGEITNIRSGINGYLFSSNLELQDIMISVCCDRDLSRLLGKQAYEYYWKYCSISNMVNGFIDAIEGSQLSRVDEV